MKKAHNKSTNIFTKIKLKNRIQTDENEWLQYINYHNIKVKNIIFQK